MSDRFLQELVDGLRCLPGVGPKSAQRMALHLLQREREAGARLGKALLDAMENIRHCEQCRNFTESPICTICSSSERDEKLLCVVESPADVMALEKATAFGGKYFVLMGNLSPLDGVGPKELGLDSFEQRLQSGVIEELTLATNATVEGVATANYLAEIARRCGIRVLQIARGIPMGGELEFADGNTLAVAFSERSEMSET